MTRQRSARKRRNREYNGQMMCQREILTYFVTAKMCHSDTICSQFGALQNFTQLHRFYPCRSRSVLVGCSSAKFDASLLRSTHLKLLPPERALPRKKLPLFTGYFRIVISYLTCFDGTFTAVSDNPDEGAKFKYHVRSQGGLQCSFVASQMKE